MEAEEGREVADADSPLESRLALKMAIFGMSRCREYTPGRIGSETFVLLLAWGGRHLTVQQSVLNKVLDSVHPDFTVS